MQFIKKYHIILTSILLFCLVLFGLNNCTTLNKAQTDNLTRLTIQYATLKFVGDDISRRYYVQETLEWT